MSLFVIGDLHLSFSVDKPMDIFGNNWENHAEKIKNNWIEKVHPEDTVILPGDFSWATYLEESKEDFEFFGDRGDRICRSGDRVHCGTDQSALTERFDRGSPCRRSRPRIRSRC